MPPGSRRRASPLTPPRVHRATRTADRRSPMCTMAQCFPGTHARQARLVAPPVRGREPSTCRPLSSRGESLESSLWRATATGRSLPSGGTPASRTDREPKPDKRRGHRQNNQGAEQCRSRLPKNEMTRIARIHTSTRPGISLSRCDSCHTRLRHRAPPAAPRSQAASAFSAAISSRSASARVRIGG